MSRQLGALGGHIRKLAGTRPTKAGQLSSVLPSSGSRGLLDAAGLNDIELTHRACIKGRLALVTHNNVGAAKLDTPDSGLRKCRERTFFTS